MRNGLRRGGSVPPENAAAASSISGDEASLTVDRLRRALADDADWLSLDEILNAPIGYIQAELADQGLAPVAWDEAALSAALHEAGETESDCPVSIGPSVAERSVPLPIERPSLVRDLHRAVMAHGQVVVSAPAGSGKTHFVCREYLRDARVREDLPRTIHVDCSALRMDNPYLLGREAVWAHFGSDDDSFRAFLATLPKQSDPLTLLAIQRLSGAGVVVFDHCEMLDRTGSVDAWLGKFLAHMRSRDINVLLVERSPAPSQRPALRGAAVWELPRIDSEDLGRWLGGPFLQRAAREGLTARAVAAVTGGRPALLRDLGLFLYHKRDVPGSKILRQFRRWRSRDDQFFTDCERLVRAARRYPRVLERVLQPGALDVPWDRAGMDADAVVELTATGAVQCDPAGRLVFASPLYRRRMARLLAPDAFAALALRSDFASQAMSWKKLRLFGEFASDALAKSLGYETNPVVGLQRLVNFLTRWGFKANVYLRDQDNARLWAPYDLPDCIGPLECRKQPNFARAAQFGCHVHADDGRIFIPIISNGGVAGMVIVLEFLKSGVPPWKQQVDIDRVNGVLLGIRSTLAQLMQRIALRRERQFQGRLWFKPKPPEPDRVGLLREVGCQSIVVFAKLAAHSRWELARFERTGFGEDGLRWVDAANQAGLEAIARHPSKRGLVLSGDRATAVFPRLAGRKAAVFMHPMPLHEDGALVAFLFEGPGAPLDGGVQAKLSRVAPDLVAAAA